MYSAVACRISPALTATARLGDCSSSASRWRSARADVRPRQAVEQAARHLFPQLSRHGHRLPVPFGWDGCHDMVRQREGDLWQSLDQRVGQLARLRFQEALHQRWLRVQQRLLTIVFRAHMRRRSVQ